MSTVVPAKTRIPAVTGLERDRLTATLQRVWDHRVTTVTAPAGSGKTTLLAQFAGSLAAGGVPVAWYQAEPSEAAVGRLLSHLEHALRPALRGRGPSWQSVEDAADHLEKWVDRRAVLFIDDLHVLEATPADAALEQLIGYAPPDLHVLTASRRPTGWNLPRLRVSGLLLEIGADDLRFRLWEVDRLFREHYREPLAHEEFAELERRTEGWAAGLKMFHLATSGKPTSERRRILRSLATRPKLARDYLARNVLEGLPDDLQTFLVRTSVLGRLSGPLCDELLATTGSDRLLREIARRQLFLSTSDDGDTWRYHEVLRSHLEAMLVEQIGEPASKVEHRRAGTLLEAGGAWSEAVRAYCRAEDWGAAAKLLANHGEQLIEDAGSWLDALPAAIADHDPWILLALARRRVASGQWQTALLSYREAERAFDGQLAAEVCRRERLLLMSWMDPLTPSPDDWVSLLRAALAHDPLHALADPKPATGPLASLTRGLIEGMAGHFEPAARHLYEFADRADSAGVGAAATFAASLCDRVAGRHDHGRPLEHSIEVLAAIGPPMLAAIGHALALDDLATVTSLMDGTTDAWDPDENRWLAASRDMALGIAVLARGEMGRDAEVLLRRAGDAFGKLGAEVLRSWAQALRALVQVKSQGPTTPAIRAVHDALHLARLTKCPGAELLSLNVLVALEPAHAGAHEAAARRLEKEGASPLGGFVTATLAPATSPAGAPNDNQPTGVTTPSVPAVHAAGRRIPADPGHLGVPQPAVLRCFGGFNLALNGESVDCTALRPRSRSALRWLALEAGRPVHREALMAGLWPEDDLASATRKLHVTVSSLRQLLDRNGTRQDSSLLVRDGQAYLLDLGPGASVDVAIFGAALGEADQARKIGDATGSIAALTRALDVYRGDLLPEEGPADWVVGHREQLRLRAADGAEALAELRTETGDVAATIAACEQGLRIDRYRDGLWRRLIAALDGNRDHAKAARVSRQYEDVLLELGLGPAR